MNLIVLLSQEEKNYTLSWLIKKTFENIQHTINIGEMKWTEVSHLSVRQREMVNGNLCGFNQIINFLLGLATLCFSL